MHIHHEGAKRVGKGGAQLADIYAGETPSNDRRSLSELSAAYSGVRSHKPRPGCVFECLICVLQWKPLVVLNVHARIHARIKRGVRAFQTRDEWTFSGVRAGLLNIPLRDEMQIGKESEKRRHVASLAIRAKAPFFSSPQEAQSYSIESTRQNDPAIMANVVLLNKSARELLSVAPIYNGSHAYKHWCRILLGPCGKFYDVL